MSGVSTRLYSWHLLTKDSSTGGTFIKIEILYNDYWIQPNCDLQLGQNECVLRQERLSMRSAKILMPSPLIFDANQLLSCRKREPKTFYKSYISSPPLLNGQSFNCHISSFEKKPFESDCGMCEDLQQTVLLETTFRGRMKCTWSLGDARSKSINTKCADLVVQHHSVLMTNRVHAQW